LQEGSEPGGEQYASGMRRLRDIINLWQTQGLKLWVNQEISVTLTDGIAVYTFGPSGTVVMAKPHRVVSGYYLYTSTNVRRPLVPMSWQEYVTLGQAGTLTANRGVITQYLVDKQATVLSVTFWRCPDATEAANGVVKLLIQTQVTNPIELDETMGFPEEWRMALRWGLADDWCTGQPQAIMDRCAQRAGDYRMALENWDVEDADTRFVADGRGGAGGSSFL
jgi:hypothetical protein